MSIMAILLLAAVGAPGAVAAAPQPLPKQWWFVTWGIDKDLWPQSMGNGVTVAVLDSGVQADLPDLAGAVLPGTDFESGAGDGRTASSGVGHGTSMAALIASRGTGTGLMGVAPEASILPVTTRTTGAYIKGIRYAADRGAKVINLSQAAPGECPPELQSSVRYAIEKDVIIIAGAGNDGTTSNRSMHPANCKGVLAVGAVDAYLVPYTKTQRQSYVDISAPGYDILTLDLDGRLNNYAGTSDATALTSGIVALIRAKFPNMKNREVVRQLVASARDVGPKGKDQQTGHGFIRPYRVFDGLIPKNAANPVFDEYDQWVKTQPQDGGDPAADDGATPKPIETDNTSSFIIFGVIGAAVVMIILFGFFQTRRRRAAAPAMLYGPAPGMGAAAGPPPNMGGAMPGPPPSMGGGVPPQAPAPTNIGPHFPAPESPFEGPSGDAGRQGPMPGR